MTQIDLVTSYDYDELALFLAEFMDDGRDIQFWLKHFRFWWDDNPAFSETEPRGWVIRDGSIRGFLGKIPSFFQFGTREVVVHSATTWRVASDYRQFSLDLFQRLVDESRSRILLNTTPIDSVVPIMLLSSFKLLPRKPFPVGLVCLDIDSLIYIYSRIRNRSLPLRRLLALVAVLATSVRSKVLRQCGGQGLSIVVKEHADQDFDDLWSRTRHQFVNTNSRSARDLNWFCFANENHPRWLLAAYDGKQLVGFIIMRRFKGRTKDRLECIDLWVDRDISDVTIALIRAVIEMAREKMIGAVLFPCFDVQMVEACRRLGLFMLPPEPARDYAKVPPEMLAVICEEDSYLVMAQGDYGYF